MLHIRRVDSGHTVALLDAAEVQELDAENFVTALKVGYDAKSVGWGVG